MRGTRLAIRPTLSELVAHAFQRVTARLTGGTSKGHAADVVTDAPREKYGRVALVGAGPGDPELLTLKALRALHDADVILHDQLVSADILALAPTHVERIDVGKKGYGRACKQTDINVLMVGLARAGRRVVRLKAGDPLMFGRLEEEVAALEDAGIAYTIVPGISAAQGAAAALCVGLTRRRGARRFQAITGHATDGRLPDDLDWSCLVDLKATTAIYMPKATIATLCRELSLRGLPSDHPAVAVFNATRPNQLIVTGTITTLPARIAAADSGAPCIILIGVAALPSRSSLLRNRAIETESREVE
jgi:uroporphyrin-III C-methyltransferase / precorrin-2 dehydrogenase / sirohydrochlorin ferrochelatase